MNTYTGMYLGMVVQNNDPDYRGRVKVYVPHIQANVYKDWYSESTGKSFSFLGKNIPGDLDRILPELKTILPWAENAMPTVGSIGSGRYNAHMEIGTISDSSRPETLEQDKHQSDLEKKYRLNEEHIGEKPGKLYESYNMWVSDAFTNTANPDDQSGVNAETEFSPYEDLPVGERLNGVNRPNQFAYNYRPTTYSNCAKGSFSIPNVGSHVWVFFQDGDPMYPVVFGAMHGREDWRGIYECNDEHGVDYPGAYENKSKAEEPVYDNNTETYRNKFVINQKGGALEFVNTDNREILKMTHYSGSFLEFNNHSTVAFSTANSQRLIQEDYYDTVKGFRNIYTERDLDYIIRGDAYRKVGYQNFNFHLKWKEEMTPLANIKSMFETKRVQGIPGVGGVLEQERSGEFIPCPVCHDTDRARYHSLNTSAKFIGMTSTHSGFNGATSATTGNRQPGYRMPIGRFMESPRNSISFDGNTTGSKVMNRPPYQSAAEHIPPGSSGKIFGEDCPCCAGKGISPSTMEGTWAVEEKKEDEAFEALLKETTKRLAVFESEMGLGGCEIVSVAKHKVENIGLVVNDFPSIRMDPVGKMYRDKMVIHDKGVFASQAPTPLIENVHVDDLPGGTLTQNVANRWNVQVGAGGVSIKTLGRAEFSASQVNIAGTQVNVGSENEVNIDGGKRLNIVSDIISIRQRRRGQVLVDSDLGVSQNVIIGGGLHVEGELSCHHITAPVEIHETEKVKLYSKLLNGLTFKCNLGGGSHVVSPHGTGHPSWTGATLTLISDSNDDHVVDYGHSHLFKNAAMHLVQENELVRKAGKGCNADENDPSRVAAEPVEIRSASEKVKYSTGPVSKRQGG